MNILLDVDTLGQARSVEEKRGIHRVVTRLAAELAVHPECQLRLCAPHFHPQAAVNIAGEKSLAGAIFADWETRTFFQSIAHKQTIAIQANDGRPLYRQPIHRRMIRKLSTLLTEGFTRWKGVVPAGILEQTDIFHSGFHVFPPQVSASARLHKFITVYDLIPDIYAPYRNAGKSAAWKDFNDALNGITPDTWGFCISEATRNDLCNRTKVDPARYSITYLAADTALFYPCTDIQRFTRVRAKYQLGERPYILALSAMVPHKNLSTIVRAFSALINQETTCDLNLVLAGAKGSDTENTVRVAQSLGIPAGRILLTGYVADEDLAALYSGAIMFVHIPFVEGFGLPPLEAMQCGTPVIVSNTSSLPEVVGNAGLLQSPTDEDALCQNILRLYRDKTLRDTLSSRSRQQARQFTWERFMSATLEGYRRALATGRD